MGPTQRVLSGFVKNPRHPKRPNWAAQSLYMKGKELSAENQDGQRLYSQCAKKKKKMGE